MLKRFLCLLCVMLCAFSSCHAARKVYPSFNGAVCDEAAVLSQKTIEDIETLNERLANTQVYVYTCHFLGGENVKQYTEELFNELYLDADDVLLTLVVGEEKYALCTGETVKNAVHDQQTVLGYNVGIPFMYREYDRAVGDFLLAFAPKLAAVNNMYVNTAGLFGTETPAQDKKFKLDGNWWSGFFGERYEEEEYSYEPYEEVETEEEQSLGSIILLIFLLVFLIHRRRDKGKKGLGFWGWIVAFVCLRAVLRFFGL